MRFTKMQGCGNDYLFLNCMDGMPEEPEQLARALSDRHFGPGADGLICVCPPSRERGLGADVRMVMFNADGSEGAMCGNGIRCLAKYAWEHGIVGSQEMVVESRAGLRRVELAVSKGTAVGAMVEMGQAEVGAWTKISVKGKTFLAVPVRIGNPHLVLELEQRTGENEANGEARGDGAAEDCWKALKAVPVGELGPLLEHWPVFPEGGGQNIEFVQLGTDGRVYMRVWERGSGETLACGTGACAAAAALNRRGVCGPGVSVEVLGGELRVRIRGDGEILLAGPAETVYEGETDLPYKWASKRANLQENVMKLAD